MVVCVCMCMHVCMRVRVCVCVVVITILCSIVLQSSSSVRDKHRNSHLKLKIASLYLLVMWLIEILTIKIFLLIKNFSWWIAWLIANLHSPNHRRTGVQPCVNGDTWFQWEVLWLSAFFQGDPWGSDRSTDRRAKWLKRCGFGQGCAFWSKNWKFLYPWLPAPENGQNLAHFGLDLENFRSNSL